MLAQPGEIGVARFLSPLLRLDHPHHRGTPILDGTPVHRKEGFKIRVVDGKTANL